MLWHPATNHTVMNGFWKQTMMHLDWDPPYPGWRRSCGRGRRRERRTALRDKFQESHRTLHPESSRVEHLPSRSSPQRRALPTTAPTQLLCHGLIWGALLRCGSVRTAECGSGELESWRARGRRHGAKPGQAQWSLAESLAKPPRGAHAEPRTQGTQGTQGLAQSGPLWAVDCLPGDTEKSQRARGQPYTN